MTAGPGYLLRPGTRKQVSSLLQPLSDLAQGQGLQEPAQINTSPPLKQGIQILSAQPHSERNLLHT
jgi:hypothetical protein